MPHGRKVLSDPALVEASAVSVVAESVQRFCSLRLLSLRPCQYNPRASICQKTGTDGQPKMLFSRQNIAIPRLLIEALDMA